MAKNQKSYGSEKLFHQMRSRGFTVVELAVVIIVLGILVAIAVPQYNGIMRRTNDTERKTDLTSLASQLEYYYGRHGAYPNLASLNTPAFRTGNKISAGDNGNFLADPKNSSTKTLSNTATPADVYSYLPLPSGCVSPTNNLGNRVSSGTFCREYRLMARLEDSTDPDRDTSITGPIAYYVKRNAASN